MRLIYKLILAFALFAFRFSLFGAPAHPDQIWQYTDSTGTLIPFRFGTDTNKVYNLTFPPAVTVAQQNEVLALTQFNNSGYSGVSPIVSVGPIISTSGGAGVVATVPTVASLKALPVTGLITGQQFRTQGYYLIGDGGGGLFTYNATDVSPDNQGSILAPNSGAGRYFLDGAVRLGLTVTYKVAQFGAYGDNSHDDTAAIQACINAAVANLVTPSQPPVIELQAKNYLVSSVGAAPAIVTSAPVIIMGNGARLSYGGTGIVWKDTATPGIEIYDLTMLQTGINKVNPISSLVATGLQLQDDSAWTLYNTVLKGFAVALDIKSINTTNIYGNIYALFCQDNNTGIFLDAPGGAFSAITSVRVMGGTITAGGFSSMAGSFGVNSVNSGGHGMDGIDFYGTIIQGVQTKISFVGTESSFRDIYFDLPSGGTDIVLTAASSYNTLEAGSGLGLQVISDLGTGNLIIDPKNNQRSTAMALNAPATTITGSASLSTLSGSTGVGTASPGELLEVSADGRANMLTARASANGAESAHFFNKSRGTRASPAAVVSGDNTGSLYGRGYDGTSYVPSTAIVFTTEGTIAASRVPGVISFQTHPDSGSALVEVAKINSAGQIVSDISTGTAPFVVSSSTNVANLNVSSLNGATFAAPGPIGSTTPSTIAGTSILSASPSAGVGYTTGAGGVITQGAGARTNGVTLNKVTGTITGDNTSLAAQTAVTFTVSDTSVAADDVPILAVKSGAPVTTTFSVSAVAANSFNITEFNENTVVADTSVPVINFIIMKGSHN